jgi:plasmid stability protein
MTQYTLRKVPAEIDEALRRAAHEAGKSLNQMALEILGKALGVAQGPVRQRDLSDVIGTWKEDPETQAALKDLRRIDPADWAS